MILYEITNCLLKSLNGRKSKEWCLVILWCPAPVRNSGVGFDQEKSQLAQKLVSTTFFLHLCHIARIRNKLIPE